ncbi:MAG: PepSY-like domain-containing protein [Dysgonamonadaceae bacterium]|nr:PepSY-like domain-containing protein [Dysgonamonadaceae bacterium]
MKKFVLLLTVIGMFSLQSASADDVVTRDIERLPQAAKNFIQKHFPNEKVSYMKIDKELLSTTYEVTFISGIELEFTKDGEWKEIDCKHTAVPAGAVPTKISEYVKTNFPGTFIKQIEKKKRRYEVELSNKLDLEFDMNENFIKIDD